MKHKRIKRGTRPRCEVNYNAENAAKKNISSRALIAKMNLDQCRDLLNNVSHHKPVAIALPCNQEDFPDQVNHAAFVIWYRSLAVKMVRDVIRTRYPGVHTHFIRSDRWGKEDQWVYTAQDNRGYFKVPAFVDKYVQSEIVGELQDFLKVQTLCQLVVKFLPQTFYEYRDNVSYLF